MSIEQIVNPTITRKTKAPSQKGFGTPLLVASTPWAQRVRTFADPDELLLLGVTAGQKLYRDALALKSQNPSPTQFKVGKRSNLPTQVLHLFPTVVDVGFEYTGTVMLADGTTEDWLYEVQDGDSVATVCDGIVAALGPIDEFTATDATTHVVATTTAEGAVLRYTFGPGINLLDETEDPGIVEDLAAIYAVDRDWYGLALDSCSSEEILAAAAWVETKMVIFAAACPDWNIGDPNVDADVASQLMALSCARTFGTLHLQAGSSLPAAWLGRGLPEPVGSITWAFKELVGIPVDSLTADQETALEAKRWSYYQEVGGQNITFESRTPSNEFVDLVQGSDWLVARISEEVFGTLTANGKVSFTDLGAEQIRSAVHTVLKRGSKDPNPILDPATIEAKVPLVAEIPIADRANRELPNVTFSGRFQGAIHRVRPLRGTVYV